MKQLIIIFLSVGLTLGATAQPKIGGTYRGGSIRSGGGVKYVRPRVTVIPPYAYAPGFRNYYGFGFRNSPFYDPFYDPFYRSQRFQSRPSQLDLAIEDIKEDYEYQIDSVKDDKTLTKDERKQKVRDLKHLRENAISDAKKNYYKEKDEKNEE
jgi:hypothetical protein